MGDSDRCMDFHSFLNAYTLLGGENTEIDKWEYVNGKIVEIKMKTLADLEAYAQAVGEPILTYGQKYFFVRDGMFYTWAKVQ